MLFNKILFSILVISLVNSVPIDDKKYLDENIKRATLETYKYNHPPSIAIPVSIVFEENGSEDEKSGNSLKLKTEISDKHPVPMQKLSSVAIPVSMVFEEVKSVSNKLAKSSKVNTIKNNKKPVPSPESSPIAISVPVVLEEESILNDKSEKSNKLPVSKQLPPQKPLSEAIPVSVVFKEEGSPNNEALKTEKQKSENNNKPITPYEKSAVGIPVAVVFEDKRVQNNNALTSETLSPGSTLNKQQKPSKETKKGEQITEPTILTLTKSDMSNNGIEVRTTNSLQTTEPNLKQEKPKVILKPQPRQYQLEYQIPVAVVYDEPINVQTSRRLKNSKEQLRVRNTSLRRRPNSASTPELSIETTTVVDDTHNKRSKIAIKQHIRSRQRVKPTQDKENIPVILQFTENENQNTQEQRMLEKTRTTSIPTTEASFEKLRSNKITQSKTTLQTQNRDTSFKAQQKEERRQDNESAKKRERNPIVPIIKSDSHAYGNSGSFSYSYEGGDGTKAFEMGELKTFQDDKTGAAVVGGFSYIDKDGKDISLTYTADENGYHPVGDHLPTPPPIPVAIQRALEYLATKTTPEPVTEAGMA